MTTAQQITVLPRPDAYSPSWWLAFAGWTRHGRDPVLLKRALGPDCPGPGEVDRAVRRLHAASGDGRRLRIYVGDARRDDLARRVLDTPLLDGPVFNAMQQRTGAERMAFVVNDLQDWSPALTEHLGALLMSMAPYRGLPPFGAEQILFAGNYAGTPFGAHQGFEHAFLCHLGPADKMFYLWSTETYRALTGGTADVADYEPLLPHGIELRLEPGDVLYLPAYWFHIGTQREYSCSVAVGMYDFPLERWLGPAVTRALAASEPWPLSDYAPFSGEGRPLGRRAAELLGSLQAGLPDTLDDRWLRCASNAGFVHRRRPTFAAPPLTPGDRVRVRRPFQVCWRPRPGDRGALDVYLRHERVAVAAHAAWPAIFRALNAGATPTIDELAGLLGAPWTAADALAVARVLAATGGLERAV